MHWQAGADATDFPARFRKRFGRPPRVLHVVNIANYAYVNALLQRRDGVEADVVDPGFYHIMASPEWIEADVKGDHGDDFAPKWSRVDLGGYRRPDWFVQGDERLAFLLLKARADSNQEEARRLARRLAWHRRLVTRDTAVPDGLARFALSGRLPGQRALRRLVRGMLGAEPAAAPASTPAPVDDRPWLAPYRVNGALIADVLSTYDVVQGYTTAAAYALANGAPNYCAYELGTLRSLPFEDSDMGRLTRDVYLAAPEVFVTNIDCLAAAARLGLAPERVHKALHGFDLDSALAYSQGVSPPAPTDGPPLFLAPARQHWRDGGEAMLKGNDVAIRGAALARARGGEFRLVLGDWGEETHLSRALVAELGLADRVEWRRPEARQPLWRSFMGATAVLDQFRSPAFGGVSLEAMALGRRLITAYDHDHGKAFFSGPPPIFNCRTPEAVADAMAACLADPLDSAGRGRAAQEWMAREHSVARQLREQYEVYEILLSRLDHDGRRWVAPAPA